MSIAGESGRQQEEATVRVPANIARHWLISDGDKALLSEVGLPLSLEPFFEADLQEAVNPLLQEPGLGHLYRIGWDKGSYLGLQARLGKVYAVRDRADAPTSFVNSSLSLFVEFMRQVGRLQGQYAKMTDRDIDSAVSELKRSLSALDEAAFADSSCWWSLVFEQMESGLY